MLVFGFWLQANIYDYICSVQYGPREFIVCYKFRNEIDSPVAPASMYCIVIENAP